jgi:tripartite-type tricarboxylate transporter receptor subunit TctC
VTNRQRASALPDVPTVAESGLPGFEATAWVGIVAPAGVPRALILRLNRDIHQVLADADMRTQLLSRGLEPAATTPEEFARHIGAEIERWSKVIRESGIRAE